MPGRSPVPTLSLVHLNIVDTPKHNLPTAGNYGHPMETGQAGTRVIVEGIPI